MMVPSFSHFHNAILVVFVISTNFLAHFLCNTLVPAADNRQTFSTTFSTDEVVAPTNDLNNNNDFFGSLQTNLSDDPGGTALFLTTDLPLESFAPLFRIKKDDEDPRLLTVYLPSTTHHFKQFIARVTDTSDILESRLRDANRTFLASPQDSSIINIHGLNPGHQYNIAILGRRSHESTLIKEESVTMEPVSLDFMRDVHDIQDQKSVELYLGNLNPGRDYSVTVTSLRNELPSHPWRGVITTKPLRPSNLAVSEVNSSCVLFSWNLPVESGADRFKIAYGALNGQNNMIKAETPYNGMSEKQQELCEGITPGQTIVFAVIAEKSRQISEPATLSRVIRPLSPKQISVDTDFERNRFRITVGLPRDEASHTEKCVITIDAEHQSREHIEQTVPVQNQQSEESEFFTNFKNESYAFPFCTMFADLTPGKRYEISAIAQSGNVSSTRILRNRAIEPGFDFDAFGLTMKEHSDGTLQIEWPQSELTRLRLVDLWKRIVGADSKLHLSLTPWPPSRGVTAIRLETSILTTPTPDFSSMVIDSVIQGACYRINLYTVTGSSGIVSERRFEQTIRMNPPQMEISLSQIGKHSASIHVFTLNKTKMRQPQFGISDDCHMSIVLQDSHRSVLHQKTLELSANAAPALTFEGLHSYHLYTVNAQITCGSGEPDFTTSSTDSSAQQCPSKTQRIHSLEFQTHADFPSPVRNFTARPINPYSAQLSWTPSEFANGLISHYIFRVVPVDQKNSTDELSSKQTPWSITFSPPQLLGDDRDPFLPPNTASGMETVVDNLLGGEHYHIYVVAVNEAGPGNASDAPFVSLKMPILAPPETRLRPELVPNSVQSKTFGIHFNSGLFSEKHGRLAKIAVIVSELSKKDEFLENTTTNEYTVELRNNTWGQVRHLEHWPPYVAMEFYPDRKSGRFSPKLFAETIGNDSSCAERDESLVCNGPLKPTTIYRAKLRLFTAHTLWTDTFYSESITTESPKSESLLQKLAAIFAVTLCSLLIVFAGIVSYSRVFTFKNRYENNAKGHRTFEVDFVSSAANTRQRSKKFKSFYNGYSNTSNRSSIIRTSSPPSNNQQARASKESQWATLKMIMAERAADCLAKLGLDGHHHGNDQQQINATSNGFLNGSPSTLNTTVTDSTGIWNTFGTGFSSTQTQSLNNSNIISPPQAKREPLRVLGGSISPPAAAGAAATDKLDAASLSSTSQNGSCLFNSPHHRRSKSLRERTGVDQRLERLPSGPPPGQKTLPWTVIKGQAPANRSRSVRIVDFIEHVKIMSADSDFRFSEEYEDLRFIGCGQTCIAADLTVNRAKNRFTNILPYDHSRVKLKPTDDEEGSDYVNASYIPGFNSRREFIAAQGPLPSTRDHFWRLVWEQGSPAIVALTKCVEKGRDKCHQYWPDNSQRSVFYADIEVTLLNESIEYEEFVIRELRLTNTAEQNHPSRIVLFYHYMAWPDFGVPDHPAGIVHFTRLFRNKLPPSPSNKPTIVHCSAGVGRSGTFIALDRLIQHIECGRPIDVYGIVYEMRLERCFMVQNENQYIFIHHCLQYVLENFYTFLINQSAIKNLTANGVFPALSPSTAVNPGYNNSTHQNAKNPNIFSQNSANSGNRKHESDLWTSSAAHKAKNFAFNITPPKIEVQQQNKAFIEDDEGIAESGL